MTIPGETELGGCLLPARKSLIDCARVWVFAVSACRGDSCRVGAGGSLQLLPSGSTLGRSAQTQTQRLTQAWAQSSCPAPSQDNGGEERGAKCQRKGLWVTVSFVQPMLKGVIAPKSYLSPNIPCTCQGRAGASPTHSAGEKLPTIWEQATQCKREGDKV